jgi:hypothetical protein
MTHIIEPGCLSRSFTIGFITLLFSTGLVACGPGPEGPATAGELTAAQGEPALESAPAERENGPTTSTPSVPQPEGAL